MGIEQRPLSSSSSSINLSYLGTSIDSFGAVGNGVTVDSLAIQNAISAAGVNGTLVFTPGKSYLVDRIMQLLPGQTILAYGAQIKRQQQFVTTSSATIVQGATSVVVASVTGFAVGQQIALLTDATHYATSNSTINAIDSGTNTISVVGSAFNLLDGLSCVAPSVFLSFDVFRTAAGCKIYGLEFDGNKANWGFYRWELTNEIHAYQGSNTIEDCFFANAPGEVIQESGFSNFASLGNSFRSNHIEFANGNGIHLSGSTGTRVVGNFITDTNLQGATIGHNGGSITVSNGVVDYLIDGNRLANGRSGVGEISSADNSGYIITNNHIKNMSTYMIESRGFNAAITDINISGNTFYNDTAPAAAVLINVNLEDTGTSTLSRLVIANNEFFNTGCHISKAKGVSAIGNSFTTTYQASDTFHNAFTLGDLSEASIVGNSTKNGNAGITLNDNNVMTGQSYNTLVDSLIHHCSDANLAPAGENADGAAASIGVWNSFLRNILHTCSDDGLDVLQSLYTIIDSCLSYGNGYGANGDGNGYKLGNPNALGNKIYNSIAANNKTRGFDGNDSPDTEIVRCLAFNQPTPFKILPTNIVRECMIDGAPFGNV